MQDECIISPVPKDKDGYPRIKWQRRCWRVSRLIWILMFGDIPSDKLVCHKCDNPGCVNPDHLYLGSFTQNMQDKIDRKRVVGNNHPGVKLKDEDIEVMRQMYNDGNMSQQAIGHIFGISQSRVSEILLGKRKTLV